MTRFYIDYKARVEEEEFYKCCTCNEETSSLYHPTTTSGGFCPKCKGDVDIISLYTVYAKVYASNEEEAVELALENGEFDTLDGVVNLMERIK